jgi:hydroxypyruvate reductase
MRQKETVLGIFEAALEAVDPYAAVRRVLSRDSDMLKVRQDGDEIVIDLKEMERVHVVGCGKAGAPMSRAIEELVGDRISTGLVVVKYGHTLPEWAPPTRIEIVEAGHPEPDAAGMQHAKEVARILEDSTERDLVIALVSGGGSAIWPLPAPPITLEEKGELTRQLLASGADIHEINVLRKHVSNIKAGWAARLAHPARVLVLLISDVIGDRLDSIASGPFAPDTTTFGEALEIVESYGLGTEIPVSIQYHLWNGMAGKIPETPKPGDAVFERVTHSICASNAQALEAARIEAEARGLQTEVVEESIDGDVREGARSFCERLKEIAKQAPERAVCLIGGGETTVKLGSSTGKGGRNQEFALASAFEIQGQERLTVLSCGTDGNDGPTDAAGAVIDGSTIGRCHGLELNPQRALESHDAYPLFEASGDLVKTGPTNSNVMDIMIGIVA